MVATAIGDFQALRAALGKLNATGEIGFEGFLRDAVAAVIGRDLRLVKAGPQGGMDAGTSVEPGKPTIGVEAKRYSKSLGLDELKRKLVDAVHQRPDLDLIVFGATTAIAENDAKDLVDLGEHSGLGVATIDWPDSATLLPPLAVLCALAPEALLARVAKAERGRLEASLSEVRAHADYAAAKDRLTAALTRPDLGWAAARRSMANWLRRALSGHSASLAALGRPAEVLDPRRPRIARPKTESALDGWAAAPSAPLALLGDEGVGKTWAALGWWESRAGADGTDLPLTLLVPAVEIGDTDGERLLARMLARRTEIRDEHFWLRRLRLWARAPWTRPAILLIIDGLNENWSFSDWARLLAIFAAEPWRGKVAVLLTCRRQHWDRLNRLCILEDRPVEETIKPFDDDELDALLARHGRTRTDFPADLLPLMRIPRLFDLAVKHAVRLAESGDVTRERLVYEDWKDRMSRMPGLSFNDAEFQDFVAGLGRTVHGRLAAADSPELHLSRRDLTDRLTEESGDRELTAVIGEIVGGLWMMPADKPHRFKLNRELTPYALGLALIEDLRAVPAPGIPERLAAFIEPLREQDLAVALLRAATTVALVSDTPAAMREALLDAWFRRQNFAEVDFEAFWRLIPVAPRAFLDLAERTWLERHIGHTEDEILIKGLSNAAERWPAVMELVARWCTEWMGTHWGDPIEGMVIGYDPKAPEVPERRRQTAERRAAWDGLVRSRAPDIPIRDGISGDVPWLACRVVGLLSYLPPSTVQRAMAAWAVSRAIMGEAPQFEQIAWVLRLRGSDAIPAAADRLLALDHPVAAKAAQWLLDALATPQAAAKADALPRPPRSLPPDMSFVRIDAQAGRIDWDHEAEFRMPRGRSLWALRDLDGHATNPDIDLDADGAAVAADIADQTNVAGMRTQLSTTDEDTSLNWSRAALARWAPDALGRLFRRLFAQAGSRKAEALNQLAWELPAHLLVLGEEERRIVAHAAGTVGTIGDDRSRAAGRNLSLASLAERSAAEQIEFFAGLPDGPDFDLGHSRILAKPSVVDYDRIAREMEPGAPDRVLLGWAAYLCHVDLSEMPDGFPPLARLFAHADPKIRRYVFTAACNAPGRALAGEFARTGWQWSETTEREEDLDSSLLLTRAAGIVEIAEIRQRIAPATLGILMLDERAGEEEIDAFLAMLRARLAEDVAGHWPPTLFGTSLDLAEAADRLVRKRPAAVEELLQPVLDRRPVHSVSFFSAAFPYIDLCRALLHQKPAIGVRLWRAMHAAYGGGVWRNDDFVMLPFGAPESAEVHALRDIVCDRAKTHEELGKIATAAIEHECQDWLLGRIGRDLKSPSAGGIARGLWLAGLLDASPQAETLWAGDLAQSRPGKFGQVDKWISCLKAATMPRRRKDHDETFTPDAFAGIQGEGGFGRHQGRQDAGRVGSAV